MHGTPRLVAGLVGLLLLTTTFGYSGPASGTQPEPDGPTPGAVLDRVGVDARGSGGVRRWPGKRITYRESLPKKWDESLRLALDAWNSAGGKLRFVKAKGGTKPQLTIGYGPTQGYAGFATIGPAKNAYVHLSTGYRNADADLEQRLGVGRLLAHELGHVVGFGHVGKGCELMVTFIPATCLLLSFEPGYRVCRWIDKPLLKKFIAAYGGKGKLAPKFCPIDPLPPQLEDVAFTGGAAAGQPVRVTWKAQPAKPGERVHIYVRAGACPSHPEGNSPDLEAFVSPTAGSWTDPNPEVVPGGHCYIVRVINKSDGSQKPFIRVVDRYAPPPAPPSVSNIVWNGGLNEWSFDATWPAGTSLVAIRKLTVTPGCPTGTDEYTTYLSTGGLFLGENDGDECIAFVSETDSGVRSTRVTYPFDVP